MFAVYQKTMPIPPFVTPLLSHKRLKNVKFSNSLFRNVQPIHYNQTKKICRGTFGYFFWHNCYTALGLPRSSPSGLLTSTKMYPRKCLQCIWVSLFRGLLNCKILSFSHRTPWEKHRFIRNFLFLVKEFPKCWERETQNCNICVTLHI